MSIEVGNILPGKVTGITNFGAFVDLGNRKTGLVHISDVSNSYIKDVLTVGDEVQVKVMEISGDGKVSLSIRRASADSSEENVEEKPKFQKSAPRNQEGQGFKKPYAAKSAPSFEKKSPSQAKVNDFDAMMSSFLKDSEDRLTSLKRNTEGKRGGRGGRRS